MNSTPIQINEMIDSIINSELSIKFKCIALSVLGAIVPHLHTAKIIRHNVNYTVKDFLVLTSSGVTKASLEVIVKHYPNITADGDKSLYETLIDLCVKETTKPLYIDEIKQNLQLLSDPNFFTPGNKSLFNKFRAKRNASTVFMHYFIGSIVIFIYDSLRRNMDSNTRFDIDTYIEFAKYLNVTG